MEIAPLAFEFFNAFGYRLEAAPILCCPSRIGFIQTQIRKVTLATVRTLVLL
jgi:hypothetical protein